MRTPGASNGSGQRKECGAIGGNVGREMNNHFIRLKIYIETFIQTVVFPQRF